MRDWIFAVLLLVAVWAVVVGVNHWSEGAAWCVGGALLAGWAWLVFVYGEAGET